MPVTSPQKPRRSERVPTTKRAESINWIDNKSLLTQTSGFLKEGFTHTINLHQGCAFAGALCGTFCYAQHNPWITKGRPWALYGTKRHIRETYRRDYDRQKRPRRGPPRPLKLYMSSSTDPYLPQESSLGLTRALLAEMVQRPPDVLMLQSHSTLISRDKELIRQLSAQCELWVSLTIETDMETVPGFPRHAFSPAARLATLQEFRAAGIRTQATLSPLLPLADPRGFAGQLDAACERIILDHYLLGDGSKNGLRTKRTSFVQRLEQAGYAEWTTLEKFWQIRDILAGVLGTDRVLVSRAGFNAVGGG